MIPSRENGKSLGVRIDPERPRQVFEKFDVVRHTARERPDLLVHRPADIAEREKLDREVLGKHQQIAVLIGGGLHQPGHLIAKLGKVADRSDKVLEARDSGSVHELKTPKGRSDRRVIAA